MYYVYMAKNTANKLYVGVSENPPQRINDHNDGRGAHFTKYIPTYNVVFLEDYPTFKEARKREIQIKKWRRDKKELLITRYKQGLETKQPTPNINKNYEDFQTKT